MTGREPVCPPWPPPTVVPGRSALSFCSTCCQVGASADRRAHRAPCAQRCPCLPAARGPQLTHYEPPRESERPQYCRLSSPRDHDSLESCHRMVSQEHAEQVTSNSNISLSSRKSRSRPEKSRSTLETYCAMHNDQRQPSHSSVASATCWLCPCAPRAAQWRFACRESSSAT
jgi:hypothetical protein